MKAIYALYMLVHTNVMVISQSNCIANNKKPPSHNLTRPSQDAFRPFGLISRACPVITKNQNPIFAIIRMGSPYQSDSMRHACDVCEEICNGMIHFSYYCKYGVLVFGDDGTGPADEPKRTKCVLGWSRQIMGGWLFIICNTITL